MKPVSKQTGSMQNERNLYGRLAYVDLLKGIAILMIVIAHSSQKIAGMDGAVYRVTSWGETGCQLFFVLSGYLLTCSKEKKKTSLKEFYLKRWTSIVPTFYIAIVFWSIVGYLQYWIGYTNGFGYIGSFKVIGINILLLNGLFSEANNSAVPGGWYIGALVILYVLFPLIHKVTALLYRKSKCLLMGFVLLLYGFSKLFLFIDKSNCAAWMVWNANSFVHQLSCLVMGIVTFYVLREYETELVHLKNRILMFSGILLAGQVVAYYCFTVAERNLMSGFLFSAVLLSGHLYYEDIRNKKISAILQSVGKNSYEIYFVHFIFVWYFMPLGQKIVMNISESNIVQMLYYVLSMCIWIPVICVLASGYHIVWNGGKNKLLSHRLQRE